MGTDGKVMVVQTPPCMECSKTSTIIVDYNAWRAWKNGALIQDAFPEMSVPDREHLKLGTHPACWVSMFGDLDEEDDDAT